MKKYLVFVFFASSIYFINPYEGLYFSNYVGIDAHLVLDSLSFQKANPYSTVAVTETDVATAIHFIKCRFQ
jgi:hypothetical protein